MMFDKLKAIVAIVAMAVTTGFTVRSPPSNITVAAYAVASTAGLAFKIGLTTSSTIDLIPDVGLGITCAHGMLVQDGEVVRKLTALLVWEAYRSYRWYKAHSSPSVTVRPVDLPLPVRLLCMILALGIVLSAVWINTWFKRRAWRNALDLEPQPVEDRVIIDEYPHLIVRQDVANLERRRAAMNTFGGGSFSTVHGGESSLAMDFGPIHTISVDTPLTDREPMPSQGLSQPTLLLGITLDWGRIEAVCSDPLVIYPNEP